MSGFFEYFSGANERVLENALKNKVLNKIIFKKFKILISS